MSLLQSERIQLLPLTREQVEFQISDQQALERTLSLNNNPIDLDPAMLDEMRRGLQSFTLPKLQENPGESDWFTAWLIIHRRDNVYIGSIGANGMPNENGEVMIGYFVDRKYDGKGVATEATGMFTSHLFKDDRLKQIIATIPIGHVASEKVVTKNGFVIEGQLEEEGMQLNRWVLRRK